MEKKLSNIGGELTIIVVLMVTTAFFLAGHAQREQAMIQRAETFQNQYEANRFNKFFSKVDNHIVTDYRIIHGDQYRMTLVDQADANTFQVYDQNSNESRYAHDKDHVFYLENIVVDADPTSFLPLDFSYGKDKDSVFYQGSEVKGADAGSFSLFSCGYAGDNAHVYRNGKVTEADPKTFDIQSCE